MDGGKTALGFGPDWIKTLVSMAIDSSHRVIREKTVLPLFMLPTLKKWEHIGFGLYVRACVCASARPSVQKVLKFHIWIPRQK